MGPKGKKKAQGKKGKGKGAVQQVPEISHPDDIFPLVLTSATQELFGCCAGEDVTRQNPHKLLEKDEIIHDMWSRAAVSDFKVAEHVIRDYPEDEMLLVYDEDFTYGYLFYLVLTPEAKDKLLKPPESETSDVIESEVSKTPEPKGWISLGSEKEIDEESLEDTLEKLVVTFSRERKMFGQNICFSDCMKIAENGDMECPSFPDSKFSIRLLTRDTAVQAVPRLQSASVQTQRRVRKNMLTQYKTREMTEEGENLLQLESFCKGVLPRMLHALQMEECFNVFTDDCNVPSSISKDAGPSQLSEGLELYMAFTDKKYTEDMKISCFNWHPTVYGVLAVALMKKKVEQMEESARLIAKPAFILFYSFSDSSHSQLLLECPDDIFAFEFCPSNPNIIVGGCSNGQVVLWDISAHAAHLQGALSGNNMASTNADTFYLNDSRNNKAPVVRSSAVSALETSHTAPITDVQWLPETFEVTRMGLAVENKMRICVQVVSCSPDCTIMFWDVRIPKQTGFGRRQQVELKNTMTTNGDPATFKHLDGTWKPLLRVSFPKSDTAHYVPLKFSLEPYTCDPEKASQSEFTHTIPDYSKLRVPSAKSCKVLEDLNSKFYLGTEHGEVVYTDWKQERDELGGRQSSKPLLCFNCHHGLVNSVQRSPFFKDIVLTTGGWNFAIWKEGLMDGPLVVSEYYEQECTVGCWSLTRPAVFFIGKDDGSIDVWDLLEKKSRPFQAHHHITYSKITCMKAWTTSMKKHFLAVTDELGFLRVLEISRILCVPVRHESSKVMEYFELETAGLKEYLKQKDLLMNQKKMEEDVEKKKEPESDKPATAPAETNGDFKEYNEYLELEKSLLETVHTSFK